MDIIEILSLPFGFKINPPPLNFSFKRALSVQQLCLRTDLNKHFYYIFYIPLSYCIPLSQKILSSVSIALMYPYNLKAEAKYLYFSHIQRQYLCCKLLSLGNRMEDILAGGKHQHLMLILSLLLFVLKFNCGIKCRRMKVLGKYVFQVFTREKK